MLGRSVCFCFNGRMLAILLAFVVPALAADCPGKEKIVLAARKKYAAVQKIPFTAPEAKEYLCADGHVTANSYKGTLRMLTTESEDELGYKRVLYFDETGKLFFIFDKRYRIPY